MTELLDKVEARGETRGEARGKFNNVYNFIKSGLVTIEQAAKLIGLTQEQLLDRFKEYKLAL